MIRHLSQEAAFQIPHMIVDLQFFMERLVLIFIIQHIVNEAVRNSVLTFVSHWCLKTKKSSTGVDMAPYFRQ